MKEIEYIYRNNTIRLGDFQCHCKVTAASTPLGVSKHAPAAALIVPLRLVPDGEDTRRMDSFKNFQVMRWICACFKHPCRFIVVMFLSTKGLKNLDSSAGSMKLRKDGIPSSPGSRFTHTEPLAVEIVQKGGMTTLALFGHSVLSS